MKALIEAVHRLSTNIRYVAVYRHGALVSSERAGLQAASSSESDKYEELIVNPTLLTLLNQRGDIDCGGMRFVLIRYGNFFEYVAPIAGGHISVGIELSVDPLPLAAKIQELVDDRITTSPWREES